MPWRYCHGICAISCYVEIISASVNGYKNHNMEGDRYEIPGNREEMQKIDQISIEQIGIPGLVLMERAALAVTEEIEKDFHG